MTGGSRDYTLLMPPFGSHKSWVSAHLNFQNSYVDLVSWFGDWSVRWLGGWSEHRVYGRDIPTITRE